MAKPIITIDEYQALLRVDFYAFIERCFLQLNPQTRFYRNWHLEVMAARLEAWRQGKIRRLIINVPPRHLKSHCASIALAAWILGHDPAAQILCVSYAQDLSDKLARDCRAIMMSPWYQRLFRTRLSPQKQSVQEFVTTAQGYRLSTSVGGILTGRGADYIIIDDPMKPNEALSDTLRRGANQWFDNTLFSRLNDKRTGRIMLIMQRLHEDDLVGHVLERLDWEVLAFAAIAEQYEEFVIENPYGTRRFARQTGDVLHPEREPLATLKEIRENLGEYNFASQYQQAPAPFGGGMVKTEWLKRYTSKDRPERFDLLFQSWDTANTVSELADYSVCTTWGVKDRHLYLLDVLRKRMDYPELKRAVHQQWQLHGATVILIEDRASGTQLIQELKAEGLHAVTRFVPEGDKVMRLHAQTATIENGFVHLPSEASWLADYLHEITTFPNAKYDDQADSTSQALAWIKQAPPEHAVSRYYRCQEVLSLHRQGFPIGAIAAKVPATIEEVERWIDEGQQRQTNVLEIDARRFSETCAGCGGEIPVNTPYMKEMDLVYHEKCLRRKMFGG